MNQDQAQPPAAGAVTRGSDGAASLAWALAFARLAEIEEAGRWIECQRRALIRDLNRRRGGQAPATTLAAQLQRYHTLAADYRRRAAALRRGLPG